MIKWALVLLILMISSASAHNFDCHGNPIPKVEGCCGPGDALLLNFDQVRQDANGVWYVIIDGSEHAVMEGHTAVQMLPSTDGCYWVWYRRQDSKRSNLWLDHDGDGDYTFYCLKGPFPT